MVYKSSLPDEVISEVPVGSRILQKISTLGDRIAIVDADTRKEFTYSQIGNDVIEFAKTLSALGVRKGHVISFFVPFDPEYVLLLVAIATCGAVTDFSCPSFDPESVTSHIDDVKPFLIVTEYDSVIKLKLEVRVLTLTELRDLQMTLDPAKRVLPGDVSIDVRVDPFVIVRSSGTTGKAKGVVHTNYSMNALVDQRSHFPKLTVDCGLQVLAMVGYGAVSAVVSSLLRGKKLVTSGKVNLLKLYEIVSKHEVDFYFCNDPVTLTEMIKRGRLTEISSLKCITFIGAPFPDHLKEKSSHELGVPILSAYGSSEAGGLSFADDVCPLNSVGKLSSNVQVRIVDPVSNAELGEGNPGEILAKSPSLMKGYLKPENEHRFAIDATGWFHTGDVGYFDSSGNLYVIDRIKNVINVSEMSIYPSQIEAILLKHSSVKDAAVIGVSGSKDLVFETLKAYIVADQPADADEILRFYNGQVPHFKHIRGGVEFIDVLPRVGLGKIDRNKLKKMHEETQ